MSAKILVVDDEPAIVEMLVYNLRRAGHAPLVARDGEEALAVAQRQQPDLVVLDLMLPRLDGLEVCRRLRRERDVPIIMLTARAEEVDRVVGLELGADDYVVKPFSVRELMARIHNVLRRAAAPPSTAAPLRCGALNLSPASREARWNDILLPLTALEFDLLHELARHAGRVLSREQLMQLVWDSDYYGDLRAVDAAVKRLRAKLRLASTDEVDALVTVRGVGYKLVLSVSASKT